MISSAYRVEKGAWLYQFFFSSSIRKCTDWYIAAGNLLTQRVVSDLHRFLYDKLNGCVRSVTVVDGGGPGVLYCDKNQ